MLEVAKARRILVPLILMHGSISLFEGGDERLEKFKFKRQAAYFSNLGGCGHGLLLALLQSIFKRLCVFLHLRYGLVGMKLIEIFRWRNPQQIACGFVYLDCEEFISTHG